MSEDVTKFLKRLLLTLILIIGYFTTLYYSDKEYTIGIASSALSFDLYSMAGDLLRSPIVIYNSNFSPDVVDDLVYPDAYTSAELPIYQKGNLTVIDPDYPSSLTGLRLTITTDSSYLEVVEYYDTELANIGWSIPSNEFKDSGLLLREYTKDTHTFTLTGADIGKTKVNYTISIDRIEE